MNVSRDALRKEAVDIFRQADDRLNELRANRERYTHLPKTVSTPWFEGEPLLVKLEALKVLATLNESRRT